MIASISGAFDVPDLWTLALTRAPTVSDFGGARYRQVVVVRWYLCGGGDVQPQCSVGPVNRNATAASAFVGSAVGVVLASRVPADPFRLVAFVLLVCGWLYTLLLPALGETEQLRLARYEPGGPDRACRGGHVLWPVGAVVAVAVLILRSGWSLR